MLYVLSAQLLTEDYATLILLSFCLHNQILLVAQIGAFHMFPRPSCRESESLNPTLHKLPSVS